MNIVNGWLLCNVSVVDRKLQELDIEQENEWQPVCIRVDQISGFRPFVENDHEEIGTILYMNGGEDYVIDVPFKELRESVSRTEKVG